MSHEITMPQLGFTMMEGTVAEWRKREGEPVAKGEILMEVTTEKVSIEVEATIGGVLEKILVPEGGTVPVGAPVCLIAVDGEEIMAVSAGELTPAFPTAGAAVASPAAGSADSSEPNIRASGLAKRLARERGIDLASLQGSGPRGRILEGDVLKAVDLRALAISHQPPAVVPQNPEPSTQNPALGTDDSGLRTPPPLPGRRLPFAGTRRLTAELMYRSAHDMAHVTLVAEVDATEALRLRGQLLPEWEKSAGVRLTFTDLIVKACGKALREHPALNATLDGEEILLHQEVNIGVAVALEDALIVPVLRDADVKPLQSVAIESRLLVERARRKALSLDDVSGGTFTVTNLGSYGIDLFTPIINPPETAILGVGRIVERPAVYNGDICKRSLMYLSLTFDHRLVDGAPAALFVQRLRELLERPYLLLA